jgi:hypothetical protein
MASPWIVKRLTPMLNYFQYEQVIETKPIDVRANMRNGKNYIIAQQPHGVISFCGLCSAIDAYDEFGGKLPPTGKTMFVLILFVVSIIIYYIYYISFVCFHSMACAKLSIYFIGCFWCVVV